MKPLDNLLQSDLIAALGWAIIHSFWQGLLIVFLLTAVLLVLPKQSGRRRYLAAYVSLSLLMLCYFATFFWALLQQPTTTAPVGMSEVFPTTAPPSVSEAITTIAVEENYWQLCRNFIEGNLSFIAMIWLVGVLFLSLKFLAELAYIQRLKYQPGQPANASHQELLNRLSQRMGLNKFVELKENLRIGGPMVIGFLKPVILVPFGLINRLSPEEVESVLLHELAHIQRYDYLFNLFQSLVEIALFFNPAMWWISSFIRSEREHCCDEIAIAQTGNQLVFIQTLAKMEEYRNHSGGMAMAFNGRSNSGILGRVKRILNNEESFQLPFKLFWSTAILLVCAVGLLAFQVEPPLSDTPALANAASAPDQDTSSREAIMLSPPDTLAKELVRPGDSIDHTDEHESSPIRETVVLATANAPSPEKLLSSGRRDTLPEDLKKLRQERMELAKELQDQEMVLQAQNREIQSAMLKLEREIKAMENEQMKELFNLEKAAQEIELQRNVQVQELEIEQNQLENQALKLEYEVQQLQNTPPQPKTSTTEEEQHKKLSELKRGLLDLEMKKRELSLAQKKNNLELEKELQVISSKRWEIQEKIKMAQNEKQLKVMELEERIQDLRIKSQMLQNENLNRLKLLEQKQMELERQQNNER